MYKQVSIVAGLWLLVAAGGMAEGTLIPEHAQIEGPFADGADVTDTCLECHEEVAQDLMRTTHWTWSRKQLVFDRGFIDTGKRHAVNNFCYGVAANLSMCTECHIGYGWKDDSFDFSDPSNLDCLVCHDTTDTYRRVGVEGGMADITTDFEHVARNVGMPRRQNCGVCHFYSGGAHGVKHGDLEGALLDASAELDVHMAVDGPDFACQECHKTERHQIPGTLMAASPGGGQHVSCTACHDGDLHDKAILNQHAASIACQTCHIPMFARGQPTKMYWDWSAAGQSKETELGPDKLPVYTPYKGRFTWERNVVPEYAWFNGTAGVHAWGDRIDPAAGALRLSWPLGSKADEGAKIYPFKLNRGRQIYDSVHRLLINPQLVGEHGFVATLDWDAAARQGMAARGLEYSGKYGFVDTEMYLRINHMVAPAEQALICKDCHGRAQTRMDWSKLGYDNDPLYSAGQARHPIKR